MAESGGFVASLLRRYGQEVRLLLPRDVKEKTFLQLRLCIEEIFFFFQRGLDCECCGMGIG